MIDPLGPIGAVTKKLPQAVEKLESGLNTHKLPFTGFITPPLPSPPVALKASRTIFQTTPFAECNLIDPFKTFELQVLTEDQLAVDDISGVLDNILPKELLDELSTLPELADYLLSKGKDLISTVVDLATKLPMDCLNTILRYVPIMTILKSIDDVISTVVGLGMDIMEFSNDALGMVFSYIAEVENLGLELVNLPTTMLSSVGLNISNILNPIYSAATLVGVAKTVIDSAVSGVSIIRSVGLANVSAVVAVIDSLSSISVGAVFTSVRVLGTSNVTTLVHIVPSLATIDAPAYASVIFNMAPERVVTLDIISNLNTNGITAVEMYSEILSTTSGQVVVDSVQAISALPQETLVYVKDLYTTYPQFTVRSVVDIFNGYDLADLNTLKTDIDTIGLQAYQGQYPDSEFSAILQLVVLYGEEILSVGITLYNNDIVNESPVYSTDSEAALAVLSIMITLNTEQLTAVVSQTPETITGCLGVIHTYGASTVNDTATALKQVLNTTLPETSPVNILDAVSTIITTADGLPTKTLLLAYESLNNATDRQLVDLRTNLSVTEIATTISGFPMADTLLLPLVKNITEEAAKSGNRKVLANMLSSYKGVLSRDYKLYILTLFLHNYKLSNDDVAMGVKAAAYNFSNTLDLILYDWQSGVRNRRSIIVHKPLLTASYHALGLLKESKTHAVGAVIQQDLTLPLPSYLYN